MRRRANGRNAARYIRAIKNNGSISAAAVDLGISQPTLSAFLKKTEEQLGAVIFDRSTTPLTLTSAGEAYLDFEDKTEKLERNLMRRISDIENLQCGELTIGGTTSLSSAYLPEAVSQFVTQFPGVKLTVVDDTLPNLAQAAIDGTVDLFIASSLQDNGNFDFLELAQERFFLCVPTNWDLCESLPKAGKDGYAVIRRDEFKLLDGCVFICMRDDQQIGRKMNDLLSYYDVEPKEIIHVNQALTGLAFTEEGVGISLVTEGALKRRRIDKMPALFLPDMLPSCEQALSRPLYIATPKNHIVSQAARQFIDILVQTTRQ